MEEALPLTGRRMDMGNMGIPVSLACTRSFFIPL